MAPVVAPTPIVGGGPVAPVPLAVAVDQPDALPVADEVPVVVPLHPVALLVVYHPPVPVVNHPVAPVLPPVPTVAGGPVDVPVAVAVVAVPVPVDVAVVPPHPVADVVVAHPPVPSVHHPPSPVVAPTPTVPGGPVPVDDAPVVPGEKKHTDTEHRRTNKNRVSARIGRADTVKHERATHHKSPRTTHLFRFPCRSPCRSPFLSQSPSHSRPWLCPSGSAPATAKE